MRVTIIADDKTIYVDGQPVPIDLSSLDPEIHAIQWNGSSGEIEYRSTVCPHCNSVSRKPNATITDISPYQPYVDMWTAEMDRLAQEVAKAAAETQKRIAAPVSVIAN